MSLPISNESRQWLLNESTALLHTDISSTVKNGVRDIWTGLAGFLLKDNVLEVAVGLTIASSFGPVVNSLISEIVLPPLSLMPFMSRSLEEKFLILKQGHSIMNYNTRAQAIEDGAIILSYGAFMDKLLNFVGLGFVMYLIRVSGIYEYLVPKQEPESKPVVEHTIKCPFCRKEISSEAKRCWMCTSWLDGREERGMSAVLLH